MFNIEEELKKLPKKPGVYIMHDKDDKIIYVGKAISLKRRVTSYFRKTRKTVRIQNMVKLIDHFEYIVCDNEQEALILECNLIKKNMPKFNVLLKDDKTYPYIKINVKDDYPNVYFTRRKLNDGARYFGPYASSTATKEMIEFIKNKFKIRQCRAFKYKDRACLNYHIKKCSGPCMGYISKEEYRKRINQIISILEGRVDEVEKQLKGAMNEASSKMEYEKAALYRDELLAVESISQKQKVSNISENDIDVIGIARSDKGLNDEADSDIVEEFIEQYYNGKKFFPSKIMIRNDFENRMLFEEWLTKMAGKKVEIKVPQKGEKVRLVEMAENNAKITLDNREKPNKNVIVDLKDTLGLKHLPHKIESYDISNISGEYMVAGMCVMIDGNIKKGLSRRFKIKTVYGQDDPKCMEEVITRRLRHSIDLQNLAGNEHLMITKNTSSKIANLPTEIKEKYEEGKGFGKLPDMILADGGITQIRATKQAIKNIEDEIGIILNIYVYGMVKNDKHQTRALMDENRNEIEVSEQIFNLITNFQNEVHNTAIGYHKYLRDKSMSKSELDAIKGIGQSKKVALLKRFGDIEKIKKASLEELMQVKGINESLALEIKRRLK